MKNIKTLLLPIFISVFLIIYGIKKSEIFSSKSIIAKIPQDCTTPDFEVVFGKFKIGTKKLAKNQIVDKDYFWIENYKILNNVENADSPYYHDYYYIFKGEIIGYDSESGDSDYKIVNPKLKIYRVKLISKFNFIFYLIVTLLFTTFTILKIKRIKKENF